MSDTPNPIMHRQPKEVDTIRTLADSGTTKPLRDQAPFQKSAQSDEMLQRQVCIFCVDCLNFSLSSSVKLWSYIVQSQSSLRNNIFSFQVEDDANEEEVAFASITLGPIPDEMKVTLQVMLQLLHQDINLIVQDAEGIRNKLLHLKGQLPTELEAAIYPAAYFESHQVKVLQAKQRISECASQDDLIT